MIAVGNAAVGKTCLIKHFCESKFSQCYHATVGVDYGFKVQNIKGIPIRVRQLSNHKARNNCTYTRVDDYYHLQVHLWDLSGDEQYYDVRTELYGAADACFLVFDVTNPQSFKSLGIVL